MKDPRIQKLAHQVVNYSCRVQPGENVLIETRGTSASDDLLIALIEEIYAAQAKPYVWRTDDRVQRALNMQITEEQLALTSEVDGMLMRRMQAVIIIGSSNNCFELSDVPEEKKSMRSRAYSAMTDYRCDHTKWCVLDYPTAAQAQLAKKTTEEFENFYFNVCTMDYAKMDAAMDPLRELMNRTDRVHIIGKGTDLTFSIKGIGAVKCSGEYNLPDGEIFTAPVRESVNGVISYNVPSTPAGFTFENVVLHFENGKIVKAEGNDTARINERLNCDEGARYIGEFALGVNPYVTSVTGKNLYDEKIGGSFHFTPGQCYNDADNGNNSAIHWDMVCIQTPEYGGGEIWFDDVLIRKDGRFVLPELEALNPENLR